MRLIGDLILAGFGQLKNARIENLAADPAEPSMGALWFNTTDGVYRGFNGDSVITLATGGNTQVLLNQIQALQEALGVDQEGDLVFTDTNYLDSTASAHQALGVLDGAIDGVAGDLAAETTRATAAEEALSTRVSTVEGAFVNKDGTVAFTGDQSMGSHKLTNVAAPEDNGDAANKQYVDSRISGLGAAFQYVSAIAGGTEVAPFDLSELPSKSAGSYYKVSAAGYFVESEEGVPFLVNTNDGLLFNSTGGVDHIDNTNSEVQGTTNQISVSGNSDTGFTVALDAFVLTRFENIESSVGAETTRATEAEGVLTTAVSDLADLVGDLADLASTPLEDATSVVDALSLLNTLVEAAEARTTNGTFVYDGSTSSTTHTVTHNLGTKYASVTVVDSNDKVVIPDSITFNSENELVVTFISAVTCKVVVVGTKAAA